MADKSKLKTEEEIKLAKMREIFETLLYKWFQACKELGFGASYLISISVHGLEHSSSPAMNFKHGYMQQLADHLELIHDLLEKEVVNEIGKKNFN